MLLCEWLYHYRSSPQFLLPPILTHNLRLCVPTLSFLYLLPPSVIQSLILPLSYFSSHFAQLSFASVSLLLPVIHCYVLPARPLTFPQPRCYSSSLLQLFSYAVLLQFASHNSFALALFFLPRSVAHSLPLSVFQLLPDQPPLPFPPLLPCVSPSVYFLSILNARQ